METPPVMEEMRRVLTETRQPPGRDPVATFSEVAGKMKVNDNVIRKFERAESGPRYGGIDKFVAAYADATNTSVFDLWDEAISRAKKDGSAKRPTAAEAAKRSLRPAPARPKRQQRPRS